MEPVHQPTPAPVRPATQPVMDVVPPRPLPAEPLKMPPQEVGALPITQPDDANSKKKSKREDKPHVTKPPKAPSNGIGLAVLATVVIVLGLGAMVVYAYLRTKGVSVF